MAAPARIRIGAMALPDPDLAEREAAYRTLLATAIQSRGDRTKPDHANMERWLRKQLEDVFDMALRSGAFERAGVNATALDDLCADLGLFGLPPYKKQPV